MAGKILHVSLWCGRVGAAESDYVLPAKIGFVGKYEHALQKIRIAVFSCYSSWYKDYSLHFSYQSIIS